MAQVTKRIPQWLKECREALGLRQDELAAKMHLTTNSIYRKESPKYAVAITDRDERDIFALLMEAAKSESLDQYPNRNLTEIERLLSGETTA